jgi:hypothetical protein
LPVERSSEAAEKSEKPFELRLVAVEVAAFSCVEDVRLVEPFVAEAEKGGGRDSLDKSGGIH